MNIIICDDEKSTCGELERMLMEYARKNGICFNIEVFFTGDSLADYLVRHQEVEQVCSKGGKTRFLTTESSEKFQSSASIFLQETIEAEHISLD